MDPSMGLGLDLRGSCAVCSVYQVPALDLAPCAASDRWGWSGTCYIWHMGLGTGRTVCEAGLRHVLQGEPTPEYVSPHLHWIWCTGLVSGPDPAHSLTPCHSPGPYGLMSLIPLVYSFYLLVSFSKNSQYYPTSHLYKLLTIQPEPGCSPTSVLYITPGFFPSLFMWLSFVFYSVTAYFIINMHSLSMLPITIS